MAVIFTRCGYECAVSGRGDAACVAAWATFDAAADKTGPDGSEVESISCVFYNFFHGIAHGSGNLTHVTNAPDPDREKRSALLDALEKVRNGANKTKIRQRIRWTC